MMLVVAVSHLQGQTTQHNKQSGKLCEPATRNWKCRGTVVQAHRPFERALSAAAAEDQRPKD
jgi:hypothetical protein